MMNLMKINSRKERGKELKKKVTAFLKCLVQLIEAVDKEITEYWREFFSEKEQDK